MQLEEYQACHSHLAPHSVRPPGIDTISGSLSEQAMPCCSIDLGHLHLAVAGLQHPPSHPCIALVELRQLGQLGEPKQDQQQIPDN